MVSVALSSTDGAAVSSALTYMLSSSAGVLCSIENLARPSHDTELVTRSFFHFDTPGLPSEMSSKIYRPKLAKRQPLDL